MKPPANASPAPVGSKTFSSGNAGAKKMDVSAAALNPEIHCVARDELRLLDLVENVDLKTRINVGQKEIGRRAKLFRNLRTETREDAQVSLQSLRRVEIVAVAAPPSKGAALSPLEAAEVDPTLLQRLELLDRIIRSYHADYADFREMTRRCRKESRRSAQ